MQPSEFWGMTMTEWCAAYGSKKREAEAIERASKGERSGSTFKRLPDEEAARLQGLVRVAKWEEARERERASGG